MELKILPSNNKAKRFRAVIKDPFGKKTINFGAKNGKTYIDHGDDTKRFNYIKRHRALGEDWNSINAGSLSRYILWGDSSNLQENINAYKRRFKV